MKQQIISLLERAKENGTTIGDVLALVREMRPVCLTCDDHGAVGSILDTVQCPDCASRPATPAASAGPMRMGEPAALAAPKVDAMDDVLNDALSNLEHDNYERSHKGYENRQADVALIRAALESTTVAGEAIQKAKHDTANAETERERVMALAYWLDQQTFEPGMLSCAAATLRAMFDRDTAPQASEAVRNVVARVREWATEKNVKAFPRTACAHIEGLAKLLLASGQRTFVDLNHPIFAFLLGEGTLRGVEFGDPHPEERGAYWWRKDLRAALASAPVAGEAVAHAVLAYGRIQRVVVNEESAHEYAEQHRLNAEAAGWDAKAHVRPLVYGDAAPQASPAADGRDAKDAAPAPEWMTCESRRPWVTNSLSHQAKKLRRKERGCRLAFRKDFMGVPTRYLADVYGEAAAVFEARIADIAAQQGEGGE